jgi:hypothetical protein
MEEMKNAYKIWIGTHEGKRLLGRYNCGMDSSGSG